MGYSTVITHDQDYEILFLMIIVNYGKGYCLCSIIIHQSLLPLHHSLLHSITIMLMIFELVCIAWYPQTSLQSSMYGNCGLVYVFNTFTWLSHIHCTDVEEVFRQEQSFQNIKYHHTLCFINSHFAY